ncbi:hypothetical protein JRO89_XS01G0403400 [Xanthoceras sorbifolium]|uniref:Cytochrome P450 n=1 Tax=Xanthoceras sorbifolium TaxID=99658 RepID=A0ABQ8IPH8_9ROSI|nr:hypothetical protein JRO89_XS01G0402500 [Xanthoceras sorbifolium]KAH7578599.1 hypothetical protein JRO89_XS01G0403400 [Xanthoceras sorbifolium]
MNETLRITNISLLNFRETKSDANIENSSSYHMTKPGSFIPFGIGSRICPGADLTKLEISILLHYFLLNYK